MKTIRVDPAFPEQLTANVAPPRPFWRLRARIYRIFEIPIRRVAGVVSEFARKRTGIGETFSTFWYGIAEGGWCVVCGHNAWYGTKYCLWIWRGCKSGGPS